MSDQKEHWSGRGFEDDYIAPGARRRHLEQVDEQEPDYDDYEREPSEPVECNCCGKEIKEGREITCPQCGEDFCWKCVETMDDCFYNWCNFCINGG